jgi:hypothetical protein
MGIHPDPEHKSTSVNACREGGNFRNRLAKAIAHSSVSHRGTNTPGRTCIIKCPNGWFSTYYYFHNIQGTTYDMSKWHPMGSLLDKLLYQFSPPLYPLCTTRLHWHWLKWDTIPPGQTGCIPFIKTEDYFFHPTQFRIRSFTSASNAHQLSQQGI